MILLVSNSNNFEIYKKIYSKKKSILCINNLMSQGKFSKFKYVKYYLESKNHNILHFLLTFSLNLFKVIKIFLMNNISKIIIVDNRSCSFFLLLIKFARLYKIKVFILNEDHPALYYSLLRNRKNYSAYKKNLKKNNNSMKSFIKISFYKRYEENIYKFLNILPTNPWAFGLDNTDYIYYFSETQKLIFIKIGIPKEKLLKFNLFETELNKKIIKNYMQKLFEFKKKMKLDKKPIIIFTLHQLVEHNLMSFTRGWQINKKVAQNLSKYLSHKYNLLLSLHPKQEYQNYKFLEKELNIKILRLRYKKVAIYSSILFITNYSSIIDIAKKYNLKIFIFKFNKFSKILYKLHKVNYIRNPKEISKIAKIKLETDLQKYSRLKKLL